MEGIRLKDDLIPPPTMNGNGFRQISVEIGEDENSLKPERSNRELVEQIGQLQDLVIEMRQNLCDALSELGSIQGSDAQVQHRLSGVETRIGEQATSHSADIEKLKSDFRVLTEKFQNMTLAQEEILLELRELHRDHIMFAAGGIRNSVPGNFRRSKSMDVMREVIDDGFSPPTQRIAPNLKAASPEDGYASEGGSGDEECERVVHRSLKLCESLRSELSPLGIPLVDDSDSSDVNDSLILPPHAYARAVSERTSIYSKKSMVQSEVACQVNDSLVLGGGSEAPTFAEFTSPLVGEMAERYEVAMELFRTERNYCNSLWNLQENVYQPLRNNDIMNAKDLNTMFPPELFEIYEQHCILLHKLQDRLRNWDPFGTILSDLYQGFANVNGPIVALYFSFVARFSRITELVKKNFVPNSKAQKFLRRHSRVMTCRSNRTRVVDALQIGTFLIFPVQRIPQYILIFQRLIKKTPPKHSDYHELEKILSGFKEIGEKMNGSMQSHILSPTSSYSQVPVKPKRKKYGKHLEAEKDTSKASSNLGSSDNLGPSFNSPNGAPSVYDKRASPMKSVMKSRSSGHSSAAALIRRSSKQSSGGLSLAPGGPVFDDDEDEGEEENPPDVVPTPPPEINVVQGSPNKAKSSFAKEASESADEVTLIEKRKNSVQHNNLRGDYRAQSELDVRGMQEIRDEERGLEVQTGFVPSTSEPYLGVDLSQMMVASPMMTSTPINPDMPPPLEFNSGLAMAQHQLLQQHRVSATLPRGFQPRPMVTDPWHDARRSSSVRKKISVVKNVNALRNNVAAFFSKKKNARQFGTVTSLESAGIPGARPLPFSSSGAENQNYEYLAGSSSLPRKRRSDPVNMLPPSEGQKQMEIARSPSLKAPNRKTRAAVMASLPVRETNHVPV